MPSRIKVRSFHRSLLFAIVGFSVLAVAFSHTVLSIMLIEEEKQHLTEDTKQWGRMISLMSIDDIINVEYDALRNKLSRTVSLSGLNYIHIYRKAPNSDKISFFTSYNRSSNHPPIAEKIAKIDELKEARISSSTIELIMPIINNDEVIGYIYLQAALDALNKQTRKYLAVLVALSTLLLVISLLISFRLKNKFTEATYPVIETISQVAQRKEFSLRSPHSEYMEIDAIGQNLNILLDRVEKHFQRKQDEVKRLDTKINDLEQKVTNRTDALKESNNELLSTLEKLHQFQNQLVESEKMASLGDMVAGVAHEVNTPIGLGVTASTLLQDRMREIKEAFENKSLKSSQLKKFLDDGDENIAIIYRNLERAASLISSFKKVAVDQSNEDERNLNIAELLDGVLLTLAPKLKSQPYQIDINCPEQLTVITKAGPINQIFINLIMNSIIHGFEGQDQGNITIDVIRMGQQLNISYRDDGKGIDGNIRNKIFDPFTTTKRGEGGSGLGMHLVYNLVTQALGGNIHLETGVVTGVHFDISFPVK